MDKLISLQQAIDTIEKHLKWTTIPDYYPGIFEAVRGWLNGLPSAQPDIIHCKDCAYCDSDVVDAPYGMTKKIFWCDRLYAGANENLIVEPDDFCSWAERRE